MSAVCHPWELYCKFIVAFHIFVAKERSLEMLVELNLALCDMQESSIFSCTQTNHLIAITYSHKLRRRGG